VESETELHLDLLSWVIYYGETLQRVATFLGHTVDAKNLEGQVKNMKNALNGPHWSEEAQCFADLVTDTNGKYSLFD
jgi:mannosyl-oligosaccharide glucosidase